jgi:hypothetical protein
MAPHEPHTSVTPERGAAGTIAEAFALAVDGGDMGRVRDLLAAGCAYREGRVCITGVAAVVELLRDAASWAERGFDDVRPATRVVSASGASARLDVTVVWFRVPGRFHRLRFERTLELDAGGRVVTLTTHCDPETARAFVTFADDSGSPQVPLGFGIHREE